MSLIDTITALAQAIGADIKSINLKKNRDRVYTNATASGTVTLNLALYDFFDITMTGNTTLAWSNIPTLSGEAITPVVRLNSGGTGYAITWPSGISTWLNAGGSAPSAPAAGKSGIFAFPYNGTTWTGLKGAAT